MMCDIGNKSRFGQNRGNLTAPRNALYLKKCTTLFFASNKFIWVFATHFRAKLEYGSDGPF